MVFIDQIYYLVYLDYNSSAMHAFLITGGTEVQRHEYIIKQLSSLGISTFDTVNLAKADLSIGIAEVRLFQKQMMLAPVHSRFNAGIIWEADLLTLDAQQALLKTIEEPPPHTQLFLETYSQDMLLPTILSRCQNVSLGLVSSYTDGEMREILTVIEKLSKAGPGTRLLILETVVKTRPEYRTWTACAIAAVRGALISGYADKSGHTLTSVIPASVLTKLLRKLMKAEIQLSANVNPRLVIDNVFLD